jgi:hypothetical protein
MSHYTSQGIGEKGLELGKAYFTVTRKEKREFTSKYGMKNHSIIMTEAT